MTELTQAHLTVTFVSNINVLIINFQSCKNKVAEIKSLTDNTDSDIVIPVGNETWLKPDIKSTDL